MEQFEHWNMKKLQLWGNHVISDSGLSLGSVLMNSLLLSIYRIYIYMINIRRIPKSRNLSAELRTWRHGEIDSRSLEGWEGVWQGDLLHKTRNAQALHLW